MIKLIKFIVIDGDNQFPLSVNASFIKLVSTDKGKTFLHLSSGEVYQVKQKSKQDLETEIES